MLINLYSVDCVFDTETQSITDIYSNHSVHIDTLGEEFVSKLTDDEILSINENL